MIAEVEQQDGTYRLEEHTPICGEHFCDTCGDCLGCTQADDPCYPDGGSHSWVIYLGDDCPHA